MSSGDANLPFAAAILGVSAVASQTVLLREFLSVLAGNELIIGIVLGNWMLLTGAGALLGRYSVPSQTPLRLIAVLLTALAFLPLITVFSLHALRNVAFPPGVAIGPVGSFIGSFALLLPYCVLAGFLFTLCAKAYAEATGPRGIAGIYAFEAVGSVVGGIVFNLLLLFLFSTYHVLLLLTAVNLGAAWTVAGGVAAPSRLRVFWVFPVVLVGLLFTDLDTLSRTMLFEGQEVVFHRDTPYGNLTITKQEEQRNFFENGILLFSTGDIIQNEEAVHYAMVQHPAPKTVLLVGGGISGTTSEILKYDVERIDYVELNPWILRLGRAFTTALEDSRVHCVGEDVRRFVRETTARYDVVLVNVPDPTTAQINRSYTLEFLQELKEKLHEDAVVSFGLLAQVDYYGAEAREVASALFSTLKRVFTHVLIVPGFRNAYLASDSELHIEVTQRVEERGIPTAFVNRYYVDDDLLKERSRALQDILNRGAEPNTDFHPVAYYRQVLYWMESFGASPWILVLVGFAVLGIASLRLNTVTAGMFTAGLAASAVEIVLLAAFQVFYGYVYQMTGLVITTFMAGLAGGAFLQGRIWRDSGILSYACLQVFSGIFCLLLPGVLLLMRGTWVPAEAAQVCFFILAFGFALLVGAQFAVATRLLKAAPATTASALYGMDLLGAALGALFVSAFLIPMLGVLEVSLVLGGLCFLASGVSFFNRKKYIAA